MLILFILGFGFLMGWLAQIILGYRGRPNAESLAAGWIGSFVGGLVISLAAGDGIDLRMSGIIGTIVGAIIVLAVWHAIRPQAHQAPEAVHPTHRTTAKGTKPKGS
jgi:uncharacterized membrane protein YeaQ/YmgE (transglycosylase-associated protein family)